MEKTQAQLIEESLERENDFFKRYTDKGINPFEPTEGD